MKVVIILSCLVAVGFAFPFSNHVKTPNRRTLFEEEVAKTFRLLDANQDGHINREEFSTYFGTNQAHTGINMNTAQWADAFDYGLSVFPIDLNNNGMVELDVALSIVMPEILAESSLSIRSQISTGKVTVMLKRQKHPVSQAKDVVRYRKTEDFIDLYVEKTRNEHGVCDQLVYYSRDST